MKDITPKMKKAIDNITTITGARYTGNTYEEASKFISKHIDEVRGKDIREYRKPTEKMLNLIEKIERGLGFPFEGSTMKEASDYIDTYLPAFKEMGRNSR